LWEVLALVRINDTLVLTAARNEFSSGIQFHASPGTGCHPGFCPKAGLADWPRSTIEFAPEQSPVSIIFGGILV